MTPFLLRLNKSAQLLKLKVALAKLTVSSSSSDVNSVILINQIKRSRSDKYQRTNTTDKPHLWNQLPTSLRIPHPNYSSPFQRPSFKHAGLTCYTLPWSLTHCTAKNSTKKGIKFVTRSDNKQLLCRLVKHGFVLFYWVNSFIFFSGYHFAVNKSSVFGLIRRPYELIINSLADISC